MSAVADGGGGCVAGARGADVAASERAEVITSRQKNHGVTPCVPRKTSSYCGSMVEFRYRGRKISQEDILYIRALIEQHPQESRRTLSTKLCEAWQWRQANGALRDMVCRGLLLMLDRAGQIELPPVSYVRHNPLANRASNLNFRSFTPTTSQKANVLHTRSWPANMVFPRLL
jgi:hypothetical protein